MKIAAAQRSKVFMLFSLFYHSHLYYKNILIIFRSNFG
ncbi:hypothetical protein M211_0936 [Acinetobacter lactucae]|nr:hypothetical protein M211_0936 [Acinetobacter lactucae]